MAPYRVMSESPEEISKPYPSAEIPGERLRRIREKMETLQEGREVFAVLAALYPICRSITGDGVRESLILLRRTVPLTICEVPTGTRVFDWTVPKEWNIRDAYIKNGAGERIVDFRKSNLHVLNYSIPVHRKLSLTELRSHLFTLPETPDWIPYRTSYYQESWGFCLTQRQLDSMREGEYEVCVDSTLEPGRLTYGEFRLQGQTDAEVLISTHACHPSLCNDNLSGMAVAARLALHLQGRPLRYSYRFLWIPGTIGSITWLATHESVLPRIRHGLVLSCVGDPGNFSYKRSRSGSAEIDRVVEHVLRGGEGKFDLFDFAPFGYDERQYCSPGINLPVGCLMRTPNGRYREYHTSADNLNFVSSQALGESVQLLLTVFDVLEQNGRFLNLKPKCEPQLGRRGLYRQAGGLKSTALDEMALLWVLNLSDGQHDLLEIARRSGISFDQISQAASALRAVGLLEPVQN